MANYHRWYHRNGATTYNNTRWLGLATQKSPLDTWIFQELLFEVKPDVMVETGRYKGGSSFYYASLMELMGLGRVLTVDIEDYPGKPSHRCVTFFLGSSTSPKILDQLRAAIAPGEKVMVTLDSDHHAPHVAEELRLYSELVTPRSNFSWKTLTSTAIPFCRSSVRVPMRPSKHFSARTRISSGTARVRSSA